MFGSFFQKKGEEMESKESLDFIINNYKDVKISSAEIRDNSASISYEYQKNFYHHNIFGPDKENICRIGQMGDVKNWVQISKEDYEKWHNGIEKISDHLDESDKYFKGGRDSDEFSIADMHMKKAKTELNKVIGKYLNKPLKFEAEYYQWDSESSNTKNINDIKIKITDFSIDATQYDKGKNSMYFTFKCDYMGGKWEFSVFNYTTSEYEKVDEIPLKDRFKKCIKMYKDESGMSRKEKRTKKYPSVINYEMVPSEWDSIEFMKQCHSIIESVPLN